MWTNEIQSQLADIGAEVGNDSEGNPSHVTIATGAGAEAIEIMVQADGSTMDLWLLRWDRTGGIADEEELGSVTTVDEAVRIARGRYDQRQAELDAAEKLWESCN